MQMGRSSENAAADVLGVVMDVTGKKDLSPDTNLRSGAGVSSFSMVLIVTRLESLYGINFAPEKIARFRTIKDIVDYVTEASST